MTVIAVLSQEGASSAIAVHLAQKNKPSPVKDGRSAAYLAVYFRRDQ